MAGLGSLGTFRSPGDSWGVSLEESQVGALHLSESALSHLKGGSDDFTKDWKAKDRNSFASALLVEKLSQIKGWPSLSSITKDFNVGSVQREPSGARAGDNNRYLFGATPSPGQALGRLLPCLSQHLLSTCSGKGNSERERLNILPKVPKPSEWLKWDIKPDLVLSVMLHYPCFAVQASERRQQC